MDVNKKLAPIREALKTERQRQGRAASELSRKAGRTRTWITEQESGRGTTNPTVERLTQWAEVVEVQEFGLYVVIDGNFISAPLVADDEPDAWDGEDV